MATQRRSGLGRGIGALIPTGEDSDSPRPVDVFFPDGRGSTAELVAVPGARMVNISPNDVVPNPQQPRTEFSKHELDELVVSIREVGLLQPIVVRPLSGAKKGEPQYELIMGERRLRASKQLGLDAIPAVVK